MRYSFTQPCCARCFERRNPGREPVRLVDAELEQCCQCGAYVKDGIYIRVDPSTVPYPTNVKD